MRSKFRLWAAILPVVLTISIFSLGILFSLNGQHVFDDKPTGFVVIFAILFIYFICLLFFGEIRTKAIVVVINDQAVIKKGFIGFGIKKAYAINELSGFKTSSLHSKNGAYEYLYLMVGNKKVIKLSEYYHKNYKELKQLLVRKNIKNLGVEYWSFVRETKEIFQ